MAAWICSRVFLLAMLSWDIYCHPLGVSKLNPQQPVPKREPGYYQPSVKEPATSYSSSALSAPVVSGYSGSSSPSLEKFAPGSTVTVPSQPGFPPGRPWGVAPPRLSGNRFSSSGPAPRPSNLSPPLPPPESGFQPGEMFNFERSSEHGDYQTETQKQAFQAPPPGIPVAAGPEGFLSRPEPVVSLPTDWYGFGYGYPYDYMFLTGQYPPGTVTHFSNSFEQGRNYWHDSHYVRDDAPLDSSAEQLIQTSPSDFVDPPSLEQSIQSVPSPVYAGYGQNGAEAEYPMAGSLAAPSYELYAPALYTHTGDNLGMV